MVQVVSSPTTLDESQTDNLQVKFYTNFNSHSIHVSAFSLKKSQFFSSNQSCQNVNPQHFHEIFHKYWLK